MLPIVGLIAPECDPARSWQYPRQGRSNATDADPDSESGVFVAIRIGRITRKLAMVREIPKNGDSGRCSKIRALARDCLAESAPRPDGRID